MTKWEDSWIGAGDGGGGGNTNKTKSVPASRVLPVWNTTQGSLMVLLPDISNLPISNGPSKLVQLPHSMGIICVSHGLCVFMGFSGGSVRKNPSANAGDPGSILGLGRSPGGGNGNPLHYSCLENPMDRGAWWATVHGVPKELDRTQQLNNNNDQKCLKATYF